MHDLFITSSRITSSDASLPIFFPKIALIAHGSKK